MNNAEGERRLRVRRDTNKTGVWPFRTAEYTVYIHGEDSLLQDIVSGRFRSGKDALKEARKLLAEQIAEQNINHG